MSGRKRGCRRDGSKSDGRNSVTFGGCLFKSHLLARLLGAHNFQQGHDVRGGEEMGAQDAVRRGHLGANLCARACVCTHTGRARCVGGCICVCMCVCVCACKWDARKSHEWAFALRPGADTWALTCARLCVQASQRRVGARGREGARRCGGCGGCGSGSMLEA